MSLRSLKLVLLLVAASAPSALAGNPILSLSMAARQVSSALIERSAGKMAKAQTQTASSDSTVAMKLGVYSDAGCTTAGYTVLGDDYSIRQDHFYLTQAGDPQLFQDCVVDSRCFRPPIEGIPFYFKIEACDSLLDEAPGGSGGAYVETTYNGESCSENPSAPTLKPL